MNIETVKELIQSLESAGELSLREEKFLKLAKAYQQLAAENVGLKEYRPEPYGIAMMEALDAFFADEEVPERAMMVAFETLCAKRMPVPATDRIYAGIKADGVEEFAAKLRIPGDDPFMDAVADGVAGAADSYAKQLREGAK